MKTSPDSQPDKSTRAAIQHRWSRTTARRRAMSVGLALLTSGTLFGPTCMTRARDASVDATKAAFTDLIIGGFGEFLIDPASGE